MDFDDLDGAEEALEDEFKPDASSVKPFAERPYDIVIYGATGFCGRLMAQHLDALGRDAGSGGRPWALAGRSRERLAAVQRGCATGPGVIVAHSEPEVQAMVGQCRVVISAAGPHAKLGEPVMRGCLAHGTQYVDISGDCLWYKQMIEKYDKDARAAGVSLVILCASPALLSDIGANLLVQRLGPVRQARCYQVNFGFMSGGSNANGRNQMETLAANPWVFRDMCDPFSLGGVRVSRRDVDEDCSSAEQDTVIPGLWLGPVGTGGSDQRLVRRSCALFEKAGGHQLQYGDDFSVVVREPCASKAAAERSVQQAGAIPGPDAAGPALEGMLRALEGGQAPPAGAGPSLQARELFYNRSVVAAEAEDGRWATCACSSGDNYETTALCAVAGALTLLEELGAPCPGACGGVLTPAYAFFGGAFADRLQRDSWARLPRHSKVSLEVADGKPSEAAIREMVATRTKDFANFTMRVQRGEESFWELPGW